MDRCICILASIIIACVLFAENLSSQPRAISSIWSLSGIGFGYEHEVNDDSFIQLDLKAETAELFMHRFWSPGGTLSFSWNMIFKSIQSNYGNAVHFYAGPGLIAGWADDNKVSAGALFGLKGQVGAECNFDRNISISASISPTLAMHLSADEDMNYNMRTYRNGLIYGILPELRIKYCF